MIYSKIRREGLAAPIPLPQTKPPAAKFASQSDAHVKTDAEIKFLYYPPYIYTEDIYIERESRKKVFVKDSMSKRKNMSFLFISLP